MKTETKLNNNPSHILKPKCNTPPYRTVHIGNPWFSSASGSRTVSPYTVSGMDISNDSLWSDSRDENIEPRSSSLIASSKLAPERVASSSLPEWTVTNSKRSSQSRRTPVVSRVGVADIGMAGLKTTRVEKSVFSKEEAYIRRVARWMLALERTAREGSTFSELSRVARSE